MRAGTMREEEANPAALALGAILDGIPESFVIGASVTQGEGVAVPVVVAVFLSNVPESLSAAARLSHARAGRAREALGCGSGWPPSQRWRQRWARSSPTACRATGSRFVNAFAAGAVLAMIADTMIPEAFRDAGRWAGFITVAGFALAFLLSTA